MKKFHENLKHLIDNWSPLLFGSFNKENLCEAMITRINRVVEEADYDEDDLLP